MATLTIDNRIYEGLVRKAEERRTTVDAMLTPMLEQLARRTPDAEERKRAFAEWIEIVKQRAVNLPPGHIVDDSRESIYEGCGE